jgi:hypothetical protein
MAEALAPSLTITGEPAEERDESDWFELFLALLIAGHRDAERLWLSLVPEGYGGMFNATAYGSSGELPTRRDRPFWWFLRDEQRYGRDTQRVPESAIFQAVYTFTSAVGDRVNANTSAMTVGTLAINQWQATNLNTLLLYTLAVWAVGRGGISQVTADDKQAIARHVAGQAVYQESFANDVFAGRYTDPDPILRRAALYVADARQQHEAARRVSHMAAGFTVEANVLDSEAEHCAPDPRQPGVPDCPTLTRIGWAPIGTLPRPGQRLCRWNCKCRMAYGRDREATVPTV